MVSFQVWLVLPGRFTFRGHNKSTRDRKERERSRMEIQQRQGKSSLTTGYAKEGPCNAPRLSIYFPQTLVLATVREKVVIVIQNTDQSLIII